MTALIAEIESGVRGCIALLTFREDWRRHFDVSARGVGRSFMGIGLALPAFIFTTFGVNHLIAENPTLVAPEATIPFSEIPVIWARFWLLFPVAAAVAAVVLKITDRYASWLVVHNWMVFVLIHLQAFLWAIYMAGILDARSLLALLSVYFMLRFLVHWRVAIGTLGLPMGLATAAAGIPLAADLIMRSLLA